MEYQAKHGEEATQLWVCHTYQEACGKFASTAGFVSGLDVAAVLARLPAVTVHALQLISVVLAAIYKVRQKEARIFLHSVAIKFAKFVS